VLALVERQFSALELNRVIPKDLVVLIPILASFYAQSVTLPARKGLRRTAQIAAVRSKPDAMPQGFGPCYSLQYCANFQSILMCQPSLIELMGKGALPNRE